MPAATPRSDAASLVDSSAQAAFATAEDGRVVAWNPAAERLLGLSAHQALGRPCYELLSGIDSFGNLYCHANCAVEEMVRCRQPVQSFELDVRRASGEFIRVDLSVAAIRGPKPSQYTCIHLMRAAHPSHGSSAPAATSGRRTDNPLPGHRALTRRQVEVLRLLADGRSPEQIAESLSISVHTVRTHVQNTLNKLEVHSAVNAVSEARRRRLV